MRLDFLYSCPLITETQLNEFFNTTHGRFILNNAEYPKYKFINEKGNYNLFKNDRLSFTDKTDSLLSPIEKKFLLFILPIMFQNVKNFSRYIPRATVGNRDIIDNTEVYTSVMKQHKDILIDFFDGLSNNAELSAAVQAFCREIITYLKDYKIKVEVHNVRPWYHDLLHNSKPEYIDIIPVLPSNPKISLFEIDSNTEQGSKYKGLNKFWTELRLPKDRVFHRSLLLHPLLQGSDAEFKNALEKRLKPFDTSNLPFYEELKEKFQNCFENRNKIEALGIEELYKFNMTFFGKNIAVLDIISLLQKNGPSFKQSLFDFMCIFYQMLQERDVKLSYLSKIYCENNSLTDFRRNNSFLVNPSIGQELDLNSPNFTQNLLATRKNIFLPMVLKVNVDNAETHQWFLWAYLNDLSKAVLIGFVPPSHEIVKKIIGSKALQSQPTQYYQVGRHFSSNTNTLQHFFGYQQVAIMFFTDILLDYIPLGLTEIIAPNIELYFEMLDKYYANFFPQLMFRTIQY